MSVWSLLCKGWALEARLTGNGINGVNEFPARANLGGLLTWPWALRELLPVPGRELAGGAWAPGAHSSSNGMVPHASTRIELLGRAV